MTRSRRFFLPLSLSFLLLVAIIAAPVIFTTLWHSGEKPTDTWKCNVCGTTWALREGQPKRCFICEPEGEKP